MAAAELLVVTDKRQGNKIKSLLKGENNIIKVKEKADM